MKRAASCAARIEKAALSGRARPSSGRRRASTPRTTELAIEARPFLIEEHGIYDSDRNCAARHGREELLPHASAPGLDDGQRNRTPDRRAHIDRCHMPE